MVQFMLDHPAGKPVEFLDLSLQILVIVFDLDSGWPLHVCIDPWHAEAPLRIVAHILAGLKDHRIYHRPAEILEIGIGLGHDIPVDNHDPQRHTDLRSGQPYAILIKATRDAIIEKTFKELKVRGYSVDVGVVESKETIEGKRKLKQLEIDFVANKGSKKYYIQSAYEMPTEEKLRQEKRSLIKVGDSFKKIVVVKDNIRPQTDEEGIVTMGLINFLLDQNSLEL